MIPATIADIIPITTTTLDGEAENLGQCLEEEEEDGIAFITTRNSASSYFRAYFRALGYIQIQEEGDF